MLWSAVGTSRTVSSSCGNRQNAARRFSPAETRDRIGRDRSARSLSSSGRSVVVRPLSFWQTWNRFQRWEMLPMISRLLSRAVVGSACPDQPKKTVEGDRQPCPRRLKLRAQVAVGHSEWERLLVDDRAKYTLGGRFSQRLQSDVMHRVDPETVYSTLAELDEYVAGQTDELSGKIGSQCHWPAEHLPDQRFVESFFSVLCKGLYHREDVGRALASFMVFHELQSFVWDFLDGKQTLPCWYNRLCSSDVPVRYKQPCNGTCWVGETVSVADGGMVNCYSVGRVGASGSQKKHLLTNLLPLVSCPVTPPSLPFDDKVEDFSKWLTVYNRLAVAWYRSHLNSSQNVDSRNVVHAEAEAGPIYDGRSVCNGHRNTVLSAVRSTVAYDSVGC